MCIISEGLTDADHHLRGRQFGKARRLNVDLIGAGNERGGLISAVLVGAEGAGRPFARVKNRYRGVRHQGSLSVDDSPANGPGGIPGLSAGGQRDRHNAAQKRTNETTKPNLRAAVLEFFTRI